MKSLSGILAIVIGVLLRRMMRSENNTVELVGQIGMGILLIGGLIAILVYVFVFGGELG